MIPGGSAGYFQRGGYHFDVGASMIFGLGQQGTTNLLTRALAAVGQHVEAVPDPVQIHYHLPGISLRVHRDYEQFLAELGRCFPQERQGIRRFYDECWQVFHCLNRMELLSLEAPRYLARMVWQHPGSCLGLARRLPLTVGAIARRHLHDPELLRFIDMECYCWSVVPADRTPLINAGMVFSDRHYGGVNYPKGGVGSIAQALTQGLIQVGGQIRYRSRVTEILTEAGRAVGVRTASGEVYRARRIISNATRWDTFGSLLRHQPLPAAERRWQRRYQKSPSFLSLHLGIDADILPANVDCHHILLEDWQAMAASGGTLFVSIPTGLDPSLAPPGRHILHAFTPSWLSQWQGLAPSEYQVQKTQAADALIARLESLFPGLSQAVELKEIGTPRSHRRFLGRCDGTYGPIPRGKPWGLLGMPFNRTAVPGLYCVGDSTFPGQGLNAVAFSGFACAHRVLADLGYLVPTSL
nr:carotenoid isomerase [Halomicronema hongdechloris]